MAKVKTIKKMTNETTTHWREVFKSDFLNAMDFTIGEQVLIKILSLRIAETYVPGEGKKDALAAKTSFHEEKELIVNKTNWDTMRKLLGNPDNLEALIGHTFIFTAIPDKRHGQVLRVVPNLPNQDGKAKEKRSLGDEEFDRMLTAIKEKTYTVEKAKDNFNLTDSQLQKLNLL